MKQGITFITAKGSAFKVSFSDKEGGDVSIAHYSLSKTPKEGEDTSVTHNRPKIFNLSNEEFEGLKDLLKSL